MTDSALAQTLLRRLETGASAAALNALDACRRICRDRGVALFLVGGSVRDLVLNREGYDLDLTMETDVAPIAFLVAEATGGKAVTHSRFGTGRVGGKGFRLDLARARRETYPHPGSLPVVEPAGLTDDLARRDFTINAIALRLEPSPAEIVDPFRGVADVHSSLVRVLHDRSFQDDATRMLRAVRYASRLEFKIATQTAALVRRDLSYLGTISGPRLRRELTLQFQEPNAVDGVRLARDLGILRAIHPALDLTEAVAMRWASALAGTRHAPLEELGFCVMANPQDEGAAASVSKWLHLTGRVEHSLQDLVRLRAQSPKLAAMRNSAAAATELLDRYQPASIWAYTVLEQGDAAGACRRYLEDWRHVRSELNGDDLIALGLAEGESMGAVLRGLRAARLDGRVRNRGEEQAYVRSLL